MTTSKFIRKGDPLGKSSLVKSVAAGLAGQSRLYKRSVHGADAAFCSRKAVLHQGVNPNSKVPMDASSALYFAVGNGIHDKVAEALDNSNILIANELLVTFGPIRGYIDNIVISDETGGLKIIDVKSCGRLPTKVKPGQAEQLLLYALISGIGEAAILYMSRSVADFTGILAKEIIVPTTEPVMQKIARTTAESIVYSKYKVVPPKPEYHVTEAGCGWCPFKNNGCFSTSESVHVLTEGFQYMEGRVDPKIENEIIEVAAELYEGRAARYKKTLATLETSARTISDTFNKWKVDNGI